MSLGTARWLALCLAMMAACGGTDPSSPSSPGQGAGPPSPSSPAQEESLPTGGAGGDTCRVTSLDESGRGTLYDCITTQAGPRTIVFDVDGTLSLPENTYVQSNLTIDAMAPGPRAITVRMPADRRRALILEGPVTNVVIRGLRFEGEYGVPDAVEYDLLALDGEDGRVSSVLVERCTFVGATDGALDITGEVSDAIVRWNLLYGNPLTMLIRYGPLERISLHRNVFAENGERNPQIRGDVRTIDQVNNVIYDWTLTEDGYGTEIRNDPGESVEGNFIGNVFLAGRPDGGSGFTIFNFSGATAGRLWVAGNLCSPPCEVTSTVGAPLPVAFPITPWPASELADRLLPGVGAPNRTPRDAAAVERLLAGLRALR